MFWRSSKFLSSFLLALGLVACSNNTATVSNSDQDPLQVVVSNTILTDITERVGGDLVSITGLLQPGDDPHIYEPVPRDTVTLSRANLIILNGYNLEPAIEKLAGSVGDRAEILRVAEAIAPLSLDSAPDPHVWGDARNGIIMAQTIQQKLCDLQPRDCPQFEANTQVLTQELSRLDDWIRQQIATIPAAQRQLVTTHDAFQYYSRAYGLPVLGALIGISTEEQPSARTVQTLAQALKQTRVPVIFTETTTNSSLLETVAAEAGIRISQQPLYADAIGTAGSNADSYVKMLTSNTQTIVLGLGGEITAFQ